MSRPALIAILVLQAASAGFFVFDMLATLLGLPIVIGWGLHELIEVGAALGLCIGLAFGALALRDALRRRARAEAQLRAASGAFFDLVEERFEQWGLTPAERDVALFAIKGLSTQEIAALRETSEGTVKAQTAAIYRKAGVASRSQLVSHFIEDLVEARPEPGAKTLDRAAE